MHSVVHRLVRLLSCSLRVPFLFSGNTNKFCAKNSTAFRQARYQFRMKTRMADASPTSGSRCTSISAANALIGVFFDLAISRNASQNSSSNDTDVLCPLSVKDRLTGRPLIYPTRDCRGLSVAFPVVFARLLFQPCYARLRQSSDPRGLFSQPALFLFDTG